MYHQLEPDEHEPVAAAVRPGGRPAVGAEAETGTNGVIMNAIPKSGGNRFSGSALANGSGPEPAGRQRHGAAAGARPDRARRRRSRSSTTSTARSAGRSSRTRCGSTPRRGTSPTSTSSPAASIRPMRPPAIRARTTRRSQAFAGTYTYDNNGRVTLGASTRSRRSPAGTPISTRWIPHWLLQVAQPVAGSRRASPPGTRSSRPRSGPTRPPTGCCSRRASWPARARTRSCSIRSRSATCPGQGSLAPRCIAIVEPDGRLHLSRADRLRLRRPAAEPDLQRVRELRDRLAQRQGRVRGAARPLLAR